MWFLEISNSEISKSKARCCCLIECRFHICDLFGPRSHSEVTVVILRSLKVKNRNYTNFMTNMHYMHMDRSEISSWIRWCASRGHPRSSWGSNLACLLLIRVQIRVPNHYWYVKITIILLLRWCPKLNLTWITNRCLFRILIWPAFVKSLLTFI